MKRKIQRGAALIAILILLIVLFLLGMAILSVKSTQAKSAALKRYSKVAKYIALAGMEDARVKLGKDMNFPPQAASDDYYFSYTETLTFPGDTTSPGRYTVTLDSSKNDPSITADHDNKIIVTSVGVACDGAGTILASHRISAVLDTSETSRSGSGNNPYLYRFIDWRDYGGL